MYGHLNESGMDTLISADIVWNEAQLRLRQQLREALNN